MHNMKVRESEYLKTVLANQQATPAWKHGAEVHETKHRRSKFRCEEWPDHKWSTPERKGRREEWKWWPKTKEIVTSGWPEEIVLS